MKQSELQELIRSEAIKIVRSELPKLIKPMVQEAVAGALSRIIAEGIIEGPPPAKAVSNRSRLDEITSTGPRRPMAPSDRRRISSNYFEPMTGNSATDNILSEIANSGMTIPDENSVHAVSILDNLDRIEATSPETVDAITKDYSKLMAKMGINRRG